VGKLRELVSDGVTKYTTETLRFDVDAERNNERSSRSPVGRAGGWSQADLTTDEL